MQSTGEGRVGSKQWAEGGRWKTPGGKQQTIKDSHRASPFEGKDRIGEKDWVNDDRLRSKEVDRDPRGGAAGG